jgi:hypothetical protein
VPTIEPAPLVLWGKPIDAAPPLPWSWVVDRLQETDDYWLVTTGPAGPTPRPVWGLWIEERLVLSVGSSSHWRNLRASTDVSVHLGDAHDVVVVEGDARQETEPRELARIVEPYNQKYDWNWEPGQPFGPILAVEPRVVLAWRAAPTEDAQDEPFPLAAGKWTFHPDD